MNKYNNNNMNNNFSRSSAGDSAMRFNKRPRYGTNNSNNNLGGGGSNNSRFKHHNSPGYQYSPNRNNPTAGDCQQLQQQQQYDKGPRQFYGISPKRPNHNNHNNMSTQQLQNKQSPQYLRKSMISSGASTSSSLASSTTFGVPPPTTLEPKQPHMLPAPVPAPNSQRPPPPLVPGMMDSSNYYSFGYNNFYGNNFKPDLMAPSTSSGPQFGGSEAMSPYMWQTIKSTPPPPTLPQPPQQLPPPPPLPPQQPPEPPMPPPPMSNLNASLAGTSSTSAMSMSAKAEDIKGNEEDKAQKSNTIVKMKTKRKAMSLRFKSCKLWCEEDALLALKAEEINSRKMEKDTILIVRFPDPEITREMVKCYSPDIESVHFQLNFAPRFCLVHLKPGTDVEKTIDHLSKIPFGTGFLSVEIKQIPHKIHSTRPNEVDPYTLYVGNLPTTIACKKLKEHFPGASRIDIGFAQRMKYTRYAFIRFASVKQAIEAYNRAYDAEIDGRNLTIRFRRITPLGEGNKDEGDSNVEHDVDHVADDINDDQQQQQQQTLESDDVTEKYLQNLNENLTQSNVTNEQNKNDKLPQLSNDEENVREKNESNVDKTSLETLERNEAQNKATNESNLTETNSVTMPLTNATEDSSNKDQAANTLLLNIKPDPDLDPDDIVIRNNDITSRLPVDNENIKQEEQIAMYEEFFEAPSQPAESTTDTVDNSTNNTQVSLPLSSADETDTMSNLSTNSLGEFLQNCQRNQSQINANEITEIPPNKRTKLANDTLVETIKKEPVEQNSSNTVQPTISNNEITTTVKQEPDQEEQESNISQRNTVNANSLGANKTVPTNQTTNILNNTSSNSLNTQITSTNMDEDMVPPTALFFRNSTSQNTNQSCDYDEFYETRINTTTTLPLAANIKSEPLELNTIERNDNNSNIPQNNLSSHISQQLSNRITTANNVMNNAIDEDDLVPPQNLLGSYRPVQSDIKREMEHDDLFTISFNNKTNRNEGHFWNSKSLEEFKNKNGSMGSLNRGESIKDSEDDVIIISDSTTPPPNPLIANTLVLGNLFLRQQPDLVTFKSKHITPPFVRNENSTLMRHHDNLDKLYEQLDADSDSDL